MNLLQRATNYLLKGQTHYFSGDHARRLFSAHVLCALVQTYAEMFIIVNVLLYANAMRGFIVNPASNEIVNTAEPKLVS